MSVSVIPMISNVTECKHDPQYPDPWDMAPGIQTSEVRAGQSQEIQKKEEIFGRKSFLSAVLSSYVSTYLSIQICVQGGFL